MESLLPSLLNRKREGRDDKNLRQLCIISSSEPSLALPATVRIACLLSLGCEVGRMCSCSGPHWSLFEAAVWRLEDLRTMQFLSIACQVEWHFQCMWLIAGQETCLSGQWKGRQLICKAREVGPEAIGHATPDLRFPFPSGAQLSEVSVIPRLALFLVMTWLEPSRGKCSHRAQRGEDITPHTEQTLFSGPLGLQDGLKPVAGKLAGNVLMGSRLELGERSASLQLPGLHMWILSNI